MGFFRQTGRARGAGGHGADQLVIGVCTVCPWTHRSEVLGRLLVPSFAHGQYRHKHDQECTYEREVVLLHLPIHRWLNFGQKPTYFQTRGPSVKWWQF